MGQPLLKTQMTQATSLFPTTAPSELLVAGPEAPARAGFERFLQDGYEEAFGANLRDHFPLIAGLIDDRGQVSAAAGVRFAENEPLFLECYLDGPVEGALAPIHGGSPRRSEIVEVGSLVSRSPLCALNLFAALAHWAAVDCGRRFAVATVTPRLESLLRRRSPKTAVTTLTCGDLVMDLLSRRVTRAGQPIDLLPREFKLLEYLMRNKDRAVTRTMLLEQVWDYRFDPHTSLIDTHISRLRKKIDDGQAAPLLHTLRGTGYRLSEKP